jgi:hypothetical protein
LVWAWRAGATPSKADSALYLLAQQTNYTTIALTHRSTFLVDGTEQSSATANKAGALCDCDCDCDCSTPTGDRVIAWVWFGLVGWLPPCPSLSFSLVSLDQSSATKPGQARPGLPTKPVPAEPNHSTTLWLSSSSATSSPPSLSSSRPRLRVVESHRQLLACRLRCASPDERRDRQTDREGKGIPPTRPTAVHPPPDLLRPHRRRRHTTPGQVR